VLVFALYKREAARLEQFLQRNNYDAVAVHGDKGQVRCVSCWSVCISPPSSIFRDVFRVRVGVEKGSNRARLWASFSSRRSFERLMRRYPCDHRSGFQTWFSRSSLFSQSFRVLRAIDTLRQSDRQASSGKRVLFVSIFPCPICFNRAHRPSYFVCSGGPRAGARAVQVQGAAPHGGNGRGGSGA